MIKRKRCHTGFRARVNGARRSMLLWMIIFGMATGVAFAEAAPQIAGDPTIVKQDLIYYDGPDFNPQRHILDLYLPGDRSNFPVLIFIHGGGWRSGNKNLYGPLGYTFAHEGIGVAIANYRLTDGSPDQVVHPGHIQDVARAFAWVHAHIAEYGGNPEKIFISGHSAGGHLVALLALDPKYLADHGLSPDTITGVIGISGVYDVRSPSFAGIFGETLEQRADASPITHVGEIEPPPFQIIYAEHDLPNLGPQAVALYEALSKIPSPAELLEILGRDHITIIVRIFLPGDETAQAMLRFIKENSGE